MTSSRLPVSEFVDKLSFNERLQIFMMNIENLMECTRTEVEEFE